VLLRSFTYPGQPSNDMRLTGYKADSVASAGDGIT